VGHCLTTTALAALAAIGGKLTHPADLANF
jgi:hypothetical protein